MAYMIWCTINSDMRISIGQMHFVYTMYLSSPPVSPIITLSHPR